MICWKLASGHDYIINEDLYLQLRLTCRACVPNLSLIMYSFSISTDELVPLKNIWQKRWVK